MNLEAQRSIDYINEWLTTGSKFQNNQRLDKNNYAVVKPDEGFDIALQLNASGDTLILYTFVSSDNTDCDNPLFLTALLSWNYNGAFLDGGVLGMCDQTMRVVLKQFFEMSQFDRNEFDTHVDRFFHATEQTRERILKFTAAQTENIDTMLSKSAMPDQIQNGFIAP